MFKVSFIFLYSQLLTYFQQQASAETEREQGFHPFRLKLGEAEVASRLIDNLRRTHKIGFRYVGNSRSYTVFKRHYFSKFIRDWMDAGQDCSLLSTATRSNAFQHLSETASFLVFLRAMMNVRSCPQLIMSTKMQISRHREILIWLISPACLATVKVNMSRKTSSLFRVLRDGWACVNEHYISFKNI